MATVGPDGKVSAVEIDRLSGSVTRRAKIATPHGPFSQPALDAVRQWEFEPTVVDGRPVTIKMPVAVNFGY